VGADDAFKAVAANDDRDEAIGVVSDDVGQHQDVMHPWTSERPAMSTVINGGQTKRPGVLAHPRLAGAVSIVIGARSCRATSTMMAKTRQTMSALTPPARIPAVNMSAVGLPGTRAKPEFRLSGIGGSSLARSTMIDEHWKSFECGKLFWNRHFLLQISTTN
jgi:hypothetical protein